MEMTAIKSSLPEESLLIGELTHRISNEFASVVSMISFAAARTQSVEARCTLTAVTDRLEDYIRVHRALQMPDTSEIVDASAHLRELCRAISRSRLDRRKIDLVFAEHPLSLKSEQCWLLGMIVYELINNAVRHAFDEDGGEIRVEVAPVGSFVECRVSDDGTAPFRMRRGRGLKIIEALAAGLHGRFAQHFGFSGSESRVTFPA